MQATETKFKTPANSLLLNDFKNTNLTEISQDMSNIMSLTTAINILITCEKRKNEGYETISPELKEAVDDGLELGIREIDKIKKHIHKGLHGKTTEREKAYLHEILLVFSYLARNELVAKTLLKNELNTQDTQIIKNSIQNLDKLSKYLEKLEKTKRIKNTDLAKVRLDETIKQINNQIFKRWLLTVNALEKREYYEN